MIAGGNTDDAGPMLEFAQSDVRPFLRLLVLHDDAERAFAYTAGAGKVLARAARDD
jgi:hypothetical protein